MLIDEITPSPGATSADSSRQKIEHAGYTRYILERKPARYNADGDELSAFDSDEEADAHATEANPYEGIKLEGMPHHSAPYEA